MSFLFLHFKNKKLGIFHIFKRPFSNTSSPTNEALQFLHTPKLQVFLTAVNYNLRCWCALNGDNSLHLREAR